MVQRDRLIHRAAVAARVGHRVRSGECLRAVAAQRAVAARHRQVGIGRAVVADGQALARQVGDGVRCGGGVRIHAARHRLARHRAADRRNDIVLNIIGKLPRRAQVRTVRVGVSVFSRAFAVLSARLPRLRHCRGAVGLEHRAALVSHRRKRRRGRGQRQTVHVRARRHRTAILCRSHRVVQRDRLIHRAAVAARVGHRVRSGECLRAVAAQRAVAARHRQVGIGRAVVADGQALARQVGDGVRCGGSVRIHAARHRLARHRATDRRCGQILHQEALRRLLRGASIIICHGQTYRVCFAALARGCFSHRSAGCIGRVGISSPSVGGVCS